MIQIYREEGELEINIMRRKDRQIKDVAKMNEIINASSVCWVAMSRKNNPYIIPMNFGFKDQCIYLHSIGEGLKIDILKEFPRVCIAFGQNIELLPASDVCESDMNYQSVLVFGEAEFITDEDKKKEALDVIVRHYYKEMNRDELKYPEASFKKVVLIKIQIEKMTGKKSV
jgi:uncharacterized protein